MNKICIVVDSGTDFVSPHPEIKVVPLRFLFKEESFNESQMSRLEFYRRAEKEWPTSSGPNPMDYREAFVECIEKGYTHILCLPISSYISISYKSAVLAKDDLESDRKYSGKTFIEVVDTNLISLSLGFLVDELSEMIKDADVSFEEIVIFSSEYYKRTRTIVAIDNVENLVKGGRATDVQKFVSDLIHIKVIVDVPHKDSNGSVVGKIVTIARVPTFRFAMRYLINKVVSTENLKRVAIVHTGNIDTASKFRENLAHELNIAPDQIPLAQVCLAIEVHSGKGALGVGVC